MQGDITPLFITKELIKWFGKLGGHTSFNEPEVSGRMKTMNFQKCIVVLISELRFLLYL